VLLSDNKLKPLLTDRVVPAWETVRPTAKVLIDFGNGKKLERTLKGNTILYLCTPEGKVIDAFPGIYTPEDFLKSVQPALNAVESGKFDGPSWHVAQIESKIQAEGARMMMSKSFVESPLLDALGVKATDAWNKKPIAMNAPRAYQQLVTRLEDLSEEPTSTRGVKRRAPKAIAENPEALAKWVIDMDSKTNVEFLRPAIHLLLSDLSDPTPSDLRDRIFKELLLVNIDDPYLGLGDLALPGTPNPNK
jgi:hypothetical protein